MSSLQYLIDVIKQAYEWLNERLEKLGLEGRKLQFAKATTLIILITIAYLVIQPIPGSQSTGLHTLRAIHTRCQAGNPPEWPLDWRPIAPPPANSDEKEDKDDNDDKDSKPAAGQTTDSLSSYHKILNLIDMEKYEGAVDLLTKNKTTAKGKELISTLNNLGQVEIHLGRYQEAIPNLLEAEKLKEEFSQSLKQKSSGDRFVLSWSEISTRANLGEAYFYVGKFEEARTNLVEADNAADALKSTLPKNGRAEIAYYLGLVNLLDKQKHLKSAMHDLQKAASLEESNIPAEGEAPPNELSNWAASNLCLAIAWQANGQLDQAKRVYKHIDEKLTTPNTVLSTESIKIVQDCTQSTLPLWQRCVGFIVPNQENDK